MVTYPRDWNVVELGTKCDIRTCLKTKKCDKIAKKGGESSA